MKLLQIYVHTAYLRQELQRGGKDYCGFSTEGFLSQSIENRIIRGGDERFSTFINVMWEMIINSKIRNRVRKVDKYFDKYSEYLGYGMYIGEKII
jgi:hypothetical protein